jgi:hypothetical protein
LNKKIVTLDTAEHLVEVAKTVGQDALKELDGLPADQWRKMSK